MLPNEEKNLDNLNDTENSIEDKSSLSEESTIDLQANEKRVEVQPLSDENVNLVNETKDENTVNDINRDFYVQPIEDEPTNINVEQVNEEEASPQLPNFTMNGEKVAIDSKNDDSTTDQTASNTGNDANKPFEKTKIVNPKRASAVKRPVLVLLLALAIGLAGGVGGSFAYNSIFKRNSVVYQNVNGSNADKSASAESLSVKDVADKTMDSVVEITTETAKMSEFFQQAVQDGAGSGVIFSEDGYIITNNHVISGANKVTVNTRDGKSYTAKLVGSDASSDLAVIKIEASGLTPAILGNSDNLSVGDGAIAIGNPLGELGGTVTTGIISALDREIKVDGEVKHLLQTNAAINPGNSGGGLFNTAGELIGIVNAKSSGTGIEGLGFAIPMNLAKEVVDSLISDGYVKGRPSIGISIQEVANQNPFTTEESEAALYIAQVTKDGAAEAAGLQVGDQITKIDDKDVTSAAGIKEIVNTHKSGDTIELTIIREKETKKVKVTLKEQVQETPEATPQSADDTFHK